MKYQQALGVLVLTEVETPYVIFVFRACIRTVYHSMQILLVLTSFYERHNSISTESLEPQDLCDLCNTECKCCCVSYSCSEPVRTLWVRLMLTRSSSMTLSHMTISNRRENTPIRGSQTLFRRMYLKDHFTGFPFYFYVENLSLYVIILHCLSFVFSPLLAVNSL